MLKLYRCVICGDPYLGEDKPTNCPFCGAPQEYLKSEDEWQAPAFPTLTPVSRANLKYTLQLEVSNATFYKCAAQTLIDVRWQAIFKALAKIEAEHASLVAKLLQTPVPQPQPEDTVCSPDLAVVKENAHGREIRATQHYQKSAAEATEPRVQEVFQALLRIESDHIALTESP